MVTSPRWRKRSTAGCVSKKWVQSSRTTMRWRCVADMAFTLRRMAMLDGKAALVTGAGRGIGRGIALALAAAGAKVVVNDLGATLDGEGGDRSPADVVVREIKAAGGEAQANYGN